MAIPPINYASSKNGSLSVCLMCVFPKSNALFMLIGITKCIKILDSSVILLTSLAIPTLNIQMIQRHTITGKMNLLNPIRILQKSSHILRVVRNIIYGCKITRSLS